MNDTEFERWERCLQTAYVAGLLDSGAYMGIKRRMPTKANKMRSPKYSLCVSVAFSDPRPSQIVATFCGLDNVLTRSRPGVRRPSFQFDVEYDAAARLLRECLPFLITRRVRAEMCIGFDDHTATSAKYRTKRIERESGVALALSDEYLARCESFYRALLVAHAGGRHRE